MREIKFRTWDTKRKEFMTNDFIYIEQDGDIIELDGETKRMMSADKFIINQYTGLKDKNGKEIYEGDVCEVEYKSGKKFINDIRYLNAAFTFRSYYLHRVAEDVLDEFCEIRVIGNIYENPELAVMDS